jgi:predicted small lipoprotein YifL
MMRSKKFFVFLAFVLVLSLSFAACGKKTDPPVNDPAVEDPADEDSNGKDSDDRDSGDNDPFLEELVKETQPSLDKTLESFGEVYSDIKASVRGSAFVYSYTYKDTLDVEATKTALEAQAGTLEKSSASLITTLAENGVKDPSIIYEYLNPDGTVIYSLEIK